MPRERELVYTPKRFIEVVKRTNPDAFADATKWNADLDNLQRSVNTVKGAKGSFDKFKACSLEYKRSKTLPPELIDLDMIDVSQWDDPFPPTPWDIEVYSFYCGLRLTESARTLAKNISPDLPRASESVKRSVPGYLRIPISAGQVPELDGYIKSKKEATSFDLFVSLATKYKKEGQAIEPNDFVGLCKYFSSLMDTEYRDHALWNLYWWLDMPPVLFENSYKDNIRGLDDHNTTKLIGNLFTRFSTQFLNSLIDLGEEHYAAVDLINRISTTPEESDDIIDRIAASVLRRDALGGIIDSVDWLASLQEIVYYENGITKEMFDLLSEKFLKYDDKKIFWVREIDDWVNVDQQVPDVNLQLQGAINTYSESASKKEYIRETIPVDHFATDVFTDKTKYLRCYGQIKDGIFIGSVGFVPKNERLSDSYLPQLLSDRLGLEVVSGPAKKNIQFAFDLLDFANGVNWNLIDEQDLPENLKSILGLVILESVREHLAKRTVSTQEEVTVDFDEVVPPQTGFYGDISHKKGPRRSEPKETKRASKLTSQRTENLPAVGETYINTIKNRRLKPEFVFDELELEEMLGRFDNSTRMLILDKLYNQQVKGSSRVKEYAHIPGPNGFPTITMRVNRAIRILGERMDNNIVLVYDIFRK